MPKKRLPNHHDLLRLFESHTLAQLAEMFQVKENTVAQKIAEARRLKISPNPALEQRRQQIEKMLKEKKSFAQIGRILGLRATSIRLFAIHHGLYIPPAGKFAAGIPIGCKDCLSLPYARGLCRRCYFRFRHRRAKNLVEYPDKLLILDHPQFKVFYKAKAGYTVHTQFLGTTHISKPTQLEQILLDQLHRQILQELDNAAIEKDYEIITQEEENGDLLDLG